MSLIIKQGDIFTSKADYLVCPVNCVGAMGKGLAKEFKIRFPECEKIYKSFCKNKYAKIKKQSVIIQPKRLNEIGDFWDMYLYDNTCILFFAIKKHWKNKSDLELIKQGLITLNELNKSKGNRNIAFPALGCGEGGLNWEDVKAMFEEVFQNCENEIELYEPIK